MGVGVVVGTPVGLVLGLSGVSLNVDGNDHRIDNITIFKDLQVMRVFVVLILWC